MIFDRTIGALVLDGLDVGFVSFRLDRLATRVGGHLWWSTYGEPVDVVEWLEVFDPAGEGERVHDGIERVPSTMVEEAWRGEWVTYVDGEKIVLRLRFLSGEEYQRAWDDWGWPD